MKYKTRKKGFTLVELLAVIVVLALIMVFAVPSVMNTMNSAKKKSLQMYAEKMISTAMQQHQSDKLLGSLAVSTAGKSTTDKTELNNQKCYNIANLSDQEGGTGSYKGFVVIKENVGATGSAVKDVYYIYITDGLDLSYVGIEYKDVVSGAGNITIDKAVAEKFTSTTPTYKCQ